MDGGWDGGKLEGWEDRREWELDLVYEMRKIVCFLSKKFKSEKIKICATKIPFSKLREIYLECAQRSY